MDRATIDVYERHAASWEARRSPHMLPEAVALGDRRPVGTAIDLGCGPGWYTAALGEPVVALDAALAMVRRAREVAPRAWPVRGDLVALPFRPGALVAGWARNAYVHLRSTDLPIGMAELHRALELDSPVELTLFGGDEEGRGVFPDDEFPGRWFSTWSETRLRDVVEGAGFVIDELIVAGPVHDVRFTIRARRARTLPDLVGPGLRLLVCGLNPSVHAADAGLGFVTPNNRFWSAAVAAGVATRDRDPWHAFHHHHLGMTDLVKRATPRAAELTRVEFATGLERLERLCAWLRPRAVCFVGLAGWRAAVDRSARPGWQDRTVGGTPAYVMPSTSGLNAATPLAALAEHLRQAATST